MGKDSVFLHEFKIDGKKYFFHSLTLELYDSPKDAPSLVEEKNILEALQVKTREDSGIVMGCMFLTTRCARQCGYCFLQGVEPADMTISEIDAGLDILGNGPADLLLYGGEPFLRPDLIRHVIQKIRASGASINLVIATGGIPMEPSLIEELVDIDAFMIVSIDGLLGIHNSNRPLKNGGDSFKDAETAFHAFKNAGCRVGISVTVTADSIAEIPKNFVWLMEHFKPTDMGLNPWLHPLKGGVANPLQASGSGILHAITSCMEIAIDGGMYIEQLARRVRPFVRKTPRLKDCSSSGGRLVQVPGEICGVCDCMTVCGDHGVPLENTQGFIDMLTESRDLSPVNFPDCLTCPVLTICGGGCRYDAYHSSGSIRGLRSERCEFEREFLAWMIKRSVRFGRNSLIPRGGFSKAVMPMPVGTMIGEEG